MAVAVGFLSHSPTLLLVAGFVFLHTLYVAYDNALHANAEPGRRGRNTPSHALVLALAGLGLAAWGVSRIVDSVAGEKIGPGIAFVLMIYVALIRDGARQRAYRP